MSVTRVNYHTGLLIEHKHIIILMHDMFGASVDAALEIVDVLLERGYSFVTVEQLMQLRDVEPEAGKRYNMVRP